MDKTLGAITKQIFAVIFFDITFGATGVDGGIPLVVAILRSCIFHISFRLDQY